MPLFFVGFKPSKGGAFLLDGTKVAGSLAFGESFLYGDYFEIFI